MFTTMYHVSIQASAVMSHVTVSEQETSVKSSANVVQNVREMFKKDLAID